MASEKRCSIASDPDDNCDAVIENLKPQRPRFWWVGIFCGVVAAFIYALNSMLVKLIQSVDSIQLTTSRCFLQTIFLLPYLTYNWRWKDVDFLGSSEMIKFLVLRGFSGSTGSLLLYQSIQRIPVGDAVTLQFTSIVFAALLAFIFLREKLTYLDGVMSLLTMAGVVLISKPTFIFGGLVGKSGLESTLGVGLGLISGFLTGCTMVVLRILGTQKVHPSLNIFFYSFIGSVTSFIATVSSSSFKLPCQHELIFIFLLAITGVGAQIFLTIGLQYEKAATFPVIRSLQIVIVYVLQITILHDNPSVLSMCGSALIFISVFGIAMKKLFNKKKPAPEKSN